MGISASPTVGYAVRAHLTDLETATIISALQSWARQLDQETHDPNLVDENIGTLDAMEIDALVERLTSSS